MKHILIFTALLILAVSLSAQTTTTGTLVTCESKNNVRHTCDLDARGRLVSVNQQLSENPCIMGKTWGVNKDRRSVWVDNGCRAEFIIGTNTVRNEAFGRVVQCSSVNNGKAKCFADTSLGVQLVRQLSKNDCTRGEDWGFDENGVWVTNGCRGEFALGGAPQFVPMTSSSRSIVKCESQNNALNRCSTDTFFGVALMRQLSNNACMRGSTWGYDANGIWVTGGCRAEFVVGQ